MGTYAELKEALAGARCADVTISANVVVEEDASENVGLFVPSDCNLVLRGAQLADGSWPQLDGAGQYRIMYSLAAVF